MRKLLIPLLVLISSFMFIIKPKADTVTDAKIFIDAKQMVDTSWLSPAVNTYLDINAGARFYSIGKYYVQYNVCFPKRDSMTITPYSNSSNDMTVKNTYKECIYSNNKTKGYTYSIIVKFNTWNGVQSNGSYYGTSSRVYFTSNNSSTVSIQLIDITVLDENQLQIIDGLDTLDKNQQETNEKLDNINNSITDETPPNTSEFGNVAGWLPAGPVDSIITLPLNVLNSISNALNGKCSTINLPLPFIDSTLPLTCGTEFYSQVSGLSLFLNTLFTILGGITLYKYFIYLYNWIDKIVPLKEQDEKWGAV